ncbi:MAG: hypothetical protein AAGD05_05160 [Bacteroidota bacterium]
MNKADLRRVVTTKIEQNRIDEALKLMSAFIKGKDAYFENDLILQTSRFNSNKNGFISGMSSKGDFERTNARIKYALTQILDGFPDKGNDVDGVVTSQPTTNATNDDVTAKQKILFLTANPDGRLNLPEEVRQVKDGLQAATHRDDFEFISEEAVRLNTIMKALIKNKPQVIHFSGHGGEKEGIEIVGDDGKKVLFPPKSLDRLFKSFAKEANCVVLSACYAEQQAKTISQHEIHVVGMKGSIPSSLALKFSLGFYTVLGEGANYEDSFNAGWLNMSASPKYREEQHAPSLWYNGKKVEV